jgi:exonuclease III
MVVGGPMVIGAGTNGGAPILSGRYMTRAFVRQEANARTPGSALDGGRGARRACENDDNDDGDGDGAGGASTARIASINIQAGYGAAGWNLQAVAEDAEQMKLYIVFVQETKIRGIKHASRAGNFDIIASETSKNNQGGVAIFVRRGAEDTHRGWSGEDAKIYDTNVVAMTFVSGSFRRRMIGVYLSPREINGDTWNGLQQACAEANDPIWILGDFNADLHSINSARMDLAQNQDTSVRTAEIKAFIATWGCNNFAHTKIQRRSTGVWTWRHRRTINGEKVTIK